MDATWLLRLDSSGSGPRVAVKDCIDVAGTPSTVGCRAIAESASAAAFDAPVVEAARRQGARIVGKTNLVELCRHADGINLWTGTPVNPVDAALIPGGSSSGSAVAVAVGEADVGIGTDTGGSVRIPAACCGIAGLKTTTGRLSTQGVFEFSRTLDTVGPLARDVAGLLVGMQLLEPGFGAEAVDDLPSTASRIRIAGVDERIDAAVDEALRRAEVETTDLQLPQWDDWKEAADDIMSAEGFVAHRALLDRADRLEPRHVRAIERGRDVTAQRVVVGRRRAVEARRVLVALLDRHGFLALPTLAVEVPRLDAVRGVGKTRLTVPLNLAGLPALSLPIPAPRGEPPTSLQLVGPPYGEERLLAVGARIEAALR